ncbi:MAG: hypothetical protein CSA29_00875 [Desulfobacterales bacterium]|nr:MAG: hypothetical protein CSA29_00875 [Desulfobacterales bacterium]
MAQGTKTSTVKGWIILISTIMALWVFAQVVGPWGEDHIPVFNEIVEIINARDIDSGAYFYTEIEASYTGETELQGAIKLKQPDQFGFTLPFMSGVVTCLLILIVGFRYLPMK